MPYAAPRPCSKHPEILLRRGERCRICNKFKNKQRGERKQRPRFYDTRLWRDVVRPGKLADDPYCEHCLLKGKHVIATEVDHIISIEQGGCKIAKSNLQSLCHSCHSSKTVRHDGGFGNRSL